MVSSCQAEFLIGDGMLHVYILKKKNFKGNNTDWGFFFINTPRIILQNQKVIQHQFKQRTMLLSVCFLLLLALIQARNLPSAKVPNTKLILSSRSGISSGSSSGSGSRGRSNKSQQIIQPTALSMLRFPHKSAYTVFAEPSRNLHLQQQYRLEQKRAKSKKVNPILLGVARAGASTAALRGTITYTQKSVFNFLSGGVAGTVASCLTNPLEVVKTQLQSSTVSKGELASAAGHPLTVAKAILERDGVMGFWKGMKPTLVSCLQTSIISWTIRVLT